jgi:predicted nucleic acid-binding protein
MIAVDTNVVVNSLDDNEPAKQAKARELITRLVRPPVTTLLPWQVAGRTAELPPEMGVRRPRHGADVVANFQDVLSLFPLRLPTPQLLDVAIDLHARFSLSHWDSMLLAACKEAAVTTLYSEDLAAGTNYDGVTVVNPFA